MFEKCFKIFLCKKLLFWVKRAKKKKAKMKMKKDLS